MLAKRVGLVLFLGVKLLFFKFLLFLLVDIILEKDIYACFASYRIRVK